MTPQLLEAIEQFNRGEYFEQHETLEALWRAEPGEVRRLYQGILQIGVAFHHLRRGNLAGARRLLARGLTAIEPFQPTCQMIDVADLFAASRRALAAIEALDPGQPSTFDWKLAPTIRMSAGGKCRGTRNEE
jgi:predicted metal-dependent hydrolase